MPIRSHVYHDHLTRFDHVLLGRLYRIPWCCLVRWVARPHNAGLRRGVSYNRHTVYVPCGIFHHRKV